jgi:hypothetical protein
MPDVTLEVVRDAGGVTLVQSVDGKPYGSVSIPWRIKVDGPPGALKAQEPMNDLVRLLAAVLTLPTPEAKLRLAWEQQQWESGR